MTTYTTHRKLALGFLIALMVAIRLSHDPLHVIALMVAIRLSHDPLHTEAVMWPDGTCKLTTVADDDAGVVHLYGDY